MNNIPILQPKTRSSIEDRVNRILRDLGNPEPPLYLPNVRELLDLDLNYYRSDDDGILQEVTHRLRIAGKQVLRKPKRILEAVRQFDLRALYIPDQQKILIDQSIPALKHRWLEAHEIGHKVLEWHEACMHGDQDYILRPEAHPKLEAEANHAAGHLIFLGDQFIREANDCQISFQTIRLLKQRYGNTFSTTLWRFIEQTHSETPLFGVIGSHPNPPSSHKDRSGPIIRYFIDSPRFRSDFPIVSRQAIEAFLVFGCKAAKGGMINEGEMLIPDGNGIMHSFYFETFYNSHDALTLAHCRRVA
ncbi:MAG: DUF955 domain-containing protein [Verrucomicrobiota bacterium JB024]|nr:DUF955 domain-containing protein [Verrucomicrobiota bacterium JB024]